MASTYATRATAIHGIAVDLRRRLEIASVGTLTDKAVLIEAGVEVVNKILHCFFVSEDLHDEIEATLNRYFKEMQPIPACIDRVFNALLAIARRFETSACEWVSRYA